MKKLNWWWLSVTGGLVIVLVLLFISLGQYNDLKAELEAGEEQNQNLSGQLAQSQASLSSLQAEYDAISEVFPPRDFASLAELLEWLNDNDVSAQPEATTVEELYHKGLLIQEAAARDGYLISVDFEVPYPFFYFVYCVAVIDGEIWLWEVETDQPFKADNWDKVK